jgi:hypothetical protein
MGGLGRQGPCAEKKIVAAWLQTRLFAAPHKKDDRLHLQVHQITF